MDLDLDDLDFDNDEIKGFLKHKLLELKANNAKIKQTITERKQHRQKIVEDANTDDSFVKVSSTWKKIFNGKYALGFTIQNGSSKVLKNIRVFLKWNLSKSIAYDVNIFDINADGTKPNHSFTCNKKPCRRMTENISKSDRVESLGYIVIVLDYPKFTKDLDTEISVNITFVGKDDRTFNLAVPKVNISSSDASDRQVSDWPISSGIVENLLTAFTCSTRTDLVMVLPEEWSDKLTSAFEIHCALTAIESASCCRKYFLARRISPIFDNSLVEIHASNEESPTVYRFTVYSRDENSLISLLHHLHQGVVGVKILPVQFYENVMLEHSSSGSEDILQSFMGNVTKEIKLVKSFLRSSKNDESIDDGCVIQFRSALMDLEKETDLLHLRIRASNDC